MTRAQQTWILGVLIVACFGGFIAYQDANDPTDPYRECWPLYTGKCKADVAVRHLMR